MELELEGQAAPLVIEVFPDPALNELGLTESPWYHLNIEQCIPLFPLYLLRNLPYE